ncbi:hypothetical protein J437_LFUL014496, partial [Ladona fulva]
YAAINVKEREKHGLRIYYRVNLGKVVPFFYNRISFFSSYVRNGVLYIQPTLTAAEFGEDFLYGGVLQYPGCNVKPCSSVAGEDIVTPIQSARIRTLGSFGFRYGRVEVRARMPRGDWIWPGKLFSTASQFCNPRPTTNKGVLIVLQYSIPNIPPLQSHFYGNGSNSGASLNQSLEDVKGDYGDGFHIFEMIWTDQKIEFYVDRTRLGGINAPEGGFWKLGGFDENPGGKNIWENGGPMAPFDRQFFFVLNVAVGGRFFPDGMKNYPYPKPWNWTSTHPMMDFWERRNWWLPTWDPIESSMWVDYIRVYSL